MMEYHILCGDFGMCFECRDSRIKITGKGVMKECTEDAIYAVRDYMIIELLGGIDCSKTSSSGYRWKTDDGRVVELCVSVKENSECEGLKCLGEMRIMSYHYPEDENISESIFPWRILKTRKQHKCCVCGKEIDKGYMMGMKSVASADKKRYNSYICLHCSDKWRLEKSEKLEVEE